jgi:hypothetical protein
MIDVGAVSYLIKMPPQELLTTINEVASKGFITQIM